MRRGPIIPASRTVGAVPTWTVSTTQLALGSNLGKLSGDSSHVSAGTVHVGDEMAEKIDEFKPPRGLDQDQRTPQMAVTAAIP